MDESKLHLGMAADGYESLAMVLDEALAQASHGKGRERHSRGEPFDEQPMQVISELLGTEKGMAFQAIKKLREGLELPTFEQKKRELLGAINYIAGILIYLEKKESGSEGAAS